MRIGKASHPGPRLRRCGPRQLDSRKAQRNRGGPYSDVPESKLENSEDGLTMLHINLRSYLSEVTTLLKGMNEKPSLISLNETLLTKGIENVQIECFVHKVTLVQQSATAEWI